MRVGANNLLHWPRFSDATSVVVSVMEGKRLPSSLHPEEPSPDDHRPHKRARVSDGQQSHTPPSNEACIELIMSQANSMFCTPSTSIYDIR
jgi:hypothetical protein